jgi:hypothetical protein
VICKMTRKSRSKISFGAIRYGLGGLKVQILSSKFTPNRGDRPIVIQGRRRISSNGKRCFGDILGCRIKGKEYSVFSFSEQISVISFKIKSVEPRLKIRVISVQKKITMKITLNRVNDNFHFKKRKRASSKRRQPS